MNRTKTKGAFLPVIPSVMHNRRRKIVYLFRIHIRPGGGSASMENTFKYCLKNHLLGVGWRTETNKNTSVWAEYFDEATKIHDNLNICKYIKRWVGTNDLVWTRDIGGEYYLARVMSGWEYFVDEEAIGDDIDIANVFRVEFQKVPKDQVPGKVIACFRAPRTIQEIADGRAREYSKHLWNLLSRQKHYEVDNTKFDDIFMMLDDEETEDLVFLYLQSLGWFIVPNSRKADSMSFEYLAVNPKTGEKALTQVKTGNVNLVKSDFSQYSCKIFLFQSNEQYGGDEEDNVVCIMRDDLKGFLSHSLTWLPAIFKTKWDMVTN